MKNVGVPDTPLRSADSTSAATRPAAGAHQVVVERSVSRPSSSGVPQQVHDPQFVLMIQQQVVHLPEPALGRGRLGRLGRRLACGCTSVSGRCRQTNRRSASPSSSRTTGSACPQYGHWKSPYSTTRDGRAGRAADVVALRIDRRDQVDELFRVAEQQACPLRLGQRGGHPEHGPGQQRRDHPGGEHADLRLGQLVALEGQVGDQQRDGEADAGDGPAAEHAGPADGRPDPAAGEPGEQPGDADHGDRLAEDVPEQHAEGDRRNDGAGQECAVDVMPAFARPNSGTMT